ncbi:hypothetical protein [Actinophytocola oryzae]|uniref:Uncharacterized protein n=1 Tax=Actinophytocola oryzae TaxID=502181 RepID=A0A4R7V227_9PSEU|nr:hypothetical protein [Actinophytocola oryzae]TDV42602.1 hypothetical protein CLV71_11772 [Actinophytocola oryzae]
MTALKHEDLFREAWHDPTSTRYELSPLDVNKVLEDRYVLDEPLVFTRAMLWDLETRKARHPDVFIPGVVAAGSAAAWGNEDVFARKSTQRLWLAPETYGLVLEQTKLDHDAQTVTFIGTTEHRGPDGDLLRATTAQPIFHVEHSVGGTETQPLNLWRTVHRTATPDARLITTFAKIEANPRLPEHIEIYIRHILGIPLTYRPEVSAKCDGPHPNDGGR